ncbi:MAG: hypothetical protein ACK8QZ_11375, partial [Anaerolineales bacterium]
MRIRFALLLGFATLLACSLPSLTLPVTSDTTAATFVVQTPPALPPVVIETLTPASPEASPTATSIPTLLPNSLYFLANDNTSGHMQLFRLERDGKTRYQLTYELSDVEDYDVSPRDGSVVYISNNQLLLVDANGRERRLLLDGGAIDPSNPWATSLDSPRWSPDGQIIAFRYRGLNFYALDSGAVTPVLADQIDSHSGFSFVRELYAPERYSPDGKRLLVRISFYEGGTFGVYNLAENTLVRFQERVCCTAVWTPDGNGVYAASASMGLMDSGLWFIDAASGNVTTLLPGVAPDGTYNFADAPYIGADGRLYFFFNNL